MPSFCLFVFPLMGKAEGHVILFADNWVCIFVCVLDVGFYIECYWWLGDARSCIKVVSFL